MANIFCTKCGHQVPDNATSCPSCGHARTGIATSPPSAAPPAFAPAHHSMGHQTPGAIAILRDTSFNEFLTLKLIKWFYIFGCILYAIVAFIVGAMGFTQSFLVGVAGILILAPILFVVLVVLLRVYLELVAAIFRIAENTTELVADLNKR